LTIIAVKECQGKRGRGEAMYCNRSGTAIRLLILVAAAVLLILVVGCSGSDKTSSDESWDERENGYEEDWETSEEYTGGDLEAGAGAVHMCGRSVLGAWFEYWGWDWDYEEPVQLDGYSLYYHEMDVPPEIVYSAAEVADDLGSQGGGVMFFKLCFADFEGGDQSSAGDNLENNKSIIREVVENAVEDNGLILILGNALPVVREYFDRWMFWNQQEYNAFIAELSSEYGDQVLVLDLYGTLASPEGWLLPEYAVDPYDSHLNAAAYSALDPVLREVLDRLPASP
jgi:hypothetical protein